MLQIYKIKTIFRHFLKIFLTIFGDPSLDSGEMECKRICIS